MFGRDGAILEKVGLRRRFAGRCLSGRPAMRRAKGRRRRRHSQPLYFLCGRAYARMRRGKPTTVVSRHCGSSKTFVSLSGPNKNYYKNSLGLYSVTSHRCPERKHSPL